MKIKYIFAFCIFLAVITGCAKPPIAEMDSAREAVFKAENDEDAVLYAGTTLARARDALKRMQESADSKQYDAAKTHAAEAVSAAEKAIIDGKAAAVRAKDESTAMLRGLRDSLDETERNINGARYSLLDLNYDDLGREFTNASNTVDRAESDHNQGSYQDALDNSRRARSSISSINEKISGAATASSSKK
ncbi:MAG: hypothetical protein FWC03_03835 [Treponema sp.]|nr:hypothetical protein [Treponema sp.]